MENHAIGFIIAGCLILMGLFIHWPWRSRK